MPTKKQIDWEAIERDYRAGVLSLREIGEMHGVSHTSVKKRAVAKGWDRDISAKIKAKADTLVSNAQVSTVATEERLETEKLTIEANARVIADVKLAHRDNIKTGRTLVQKLIEELLEECNQGESLETLGEMMQDKDAKFDPLYAAYKKAISLPGRASTIKTLSDALANLIKLERQAFNLDVDYEGQKTEEKEIDIRDVARRIAYSLNRAMDPRNSTTKIEYDRSSE